MDYPFTGDYKVTQKFGNRNCGWYKNFPNCGHPGIDFGTPVGTLILPARDGMVIRSELDGGVGKGYGNLVVLDHGDFQTWHGHLLTIDIAKGAKVIAGKTRLGLSGGEKGLPESGTSTGPHLHFGVNINGGKNDGFVDPIEYLKNKEEDMTKEEVEQIVKDLLKSQLAPFWIMDDGKMVAVNYNEKTYAIVPGYKKDEYSAQMLYRLKFKGLGLKSEFDEFTKVNFGKLFK